MTTTPDDLRTLAAEARALAARKIEDSADADAALMMLGLVSTKLDEAADRLAALTTPQDGGDALEARQLSKGDREALSDLLFYSEMGRKIPMNQCESAADKTADAVLTAGFSRAAVPDAATKASSSAVTASEWASRTYEGSCSNPQCQLTRAHSGPCISTTELVPETLVNAVAAERDAALAVIERVRAIHVRDSVLRDYCAECSDFGTDQYPSGQMIEWPCPTVAALDGAPEPEWDSITIPRPVVPFGPRGVPENDATADYLLGVIRKIDEGYAVIGGSNVTATVRKLLAEVGLALRALLVGGETDGE